MSGFNLSKGTSFNLSKAAPGLSVAYVGLGWDANDDPNGPIFDLDVSAFCLGENGQISEMTDFVFYGSEQKTLLDGEDEERPYSTDSSVYGAIDEIGGGEGEDEDEDEDGDEEDMRIYFERVANHIKEIVVVVTITKFPHDEEKDKRTLDLDMSQVKGCYARIIDDATGTELCTYTLSDDFGKEDAVEIGKFSKDSSGEWNFKAIGEGYEGGVMTFIKKYAKNF
jgi:tellurium resistance protein TerD